MQKLQQVIDRCYVRKVVLKFAKSWVGFREAKFFGYRVRAKTDEYSGSYGLDEDRKQALMDQKMPTSVKSMQRFLGAALFFSEFIPCYAEKSQLFCDMTRQYFCWDPGTWTKDYVGAFDVLRQALLDSVDKLFPDNELNWILRVDASDTAVGAVLLQIKIVDGKEVCPDPR